MKVAVVIVAYASERVLTRCLLALAAQTRQADQVVIVDNNSPEPTYLNTLPPVQHCQVIRNQVNVGFCGGNNIGYHACRNADYILFLNPDAFLSSDFVVKATEWLERPENHKVGALTGTLLGFDIDQGRATGLIDSMGIEQTWYGRWYDRSHGSPLSRAEPITEASEIAAICGALMLCRTRALEDILIRGKEPFDERFFMYKEDIDLSLRLRRKGWKLVYVPELVCHHGRGWQSRRQMTTRAKYLSARNDLIVCFRHKTRGMLYSALKYAYVILVEKVIESTTSK